MTGGSPVLIASSPPTAGQRAAVASPGPRPSIDLSSSSPLQQLPSPSTFFRTHSTSTKSAYWTQSPHFRLNPGLTTSTRLLTEQVSAAARFRSTADKAVVPCVASAQDGEGHRANGWPEPCERQGESQARGKRSGQEQDRVAETVTEVEAPPQSSKPACVFISESIKPPAEQDRVLSPAIDCQKDAAGDITIESMVTTAKNVPSAVVGHKKPPTARKRVQTASSKTSTSRTARKRFAKSASIVLNSDEPDDSVAVEYHAVNQSAQPGGWSSLLPEKVSTVDVLGQQVDDPPRTAVQHDEDVNLEAQYRMHRRRSWTPVRNTESAVDCPTEQPADKTASASPRSPDARVSLATLVSRFSHTESTTDASIPVIDLCGPPATKRRRVSAEQLSATRPVKPQRKPKAPKAERKKRAKVVKGPKTITALATLAFQPQATENPELNDTPNALSTTTAAVDHPTVDTASHVAAGKSSTRSRAKSRGQPERTTKSKPARPSKAKENRKTSPESHLLPPIEARVHERKQEFLFGTSSQLAVDESPTFIREIQYAIQDSEAISATQMLATQLRKSSAKVPTAPHGTLLSVGQADRDLWCNAARDSNGSVLAIESKSKAPPIHPEKLGLEPIATAHPLNEPALAQRCVAQGSEHDAVHLPEPCPSPVPQKFETSPAPRPLGLGCKPPESLIEERIVEYLSSDDQDYNDSWMLLESEKSTTGSPAGPMLSRCPDTVPLQVPPATVPKPRIALRALDSNITPNKISPFKSSPVPKSPFSTTSAQGIRKSPSPTKRRGRPAKATITTSLGKTTSVDQNLGKISKAAVSKVKVATSAVPSALHAPLSEFRDIDEISDSDVPPTPSPPRRKARSLSPPVQTLDLCANDSVNNSVPGVIASIIKPGDVHWPSIQKMIFPQISTAIRSTPPSQDMQHPTWHEKILLYDPIVLEDLTAWLNAQGVCFKVRRPKPKAKSRGRKKKVTQDPETEYETCTEQLKPWMVQKWCEDKSICCLWKEGLRGGVRTKY